MNIQEFAKLLDGRQYHNEITVDEVEKAKELGYIVVCGYSDDGCEIYGAFREEYDCFNGGVIEDERLPKPITAVWCDKDRGCAWSYKTDMPYAEFNIFEDDELYCVGMVIELGAVLKPCPLCGGGVVKWESGYGSVQVLQCENCLTRFVLPAKCYNPVELAKQWNRRV